MRWKHIAAMGAFLLAGAAALPAQEGLGGVGITVFEDAGYRGRSATFRDDVPELGEYHLNDRISSFRIPRGEYWEVCEHKDFGGRCAVFSGDEPDLRRVSWDDQISSLRRVSRGRSGDRGSDRDRDRDPDGRSDSSRGRSRFGLILYDDENFRGQARELDRPETSLGDFSNRASSLEARGGAWEICDRADFRGRCVTVSGEVSDLRAYGMHDRIASARPAGRDWSAEGRRDEPRERREAPRLVLFERPNYRGRSRELTDGDEKISDFSDRAQSARVFGGAWQVCEHARFRGRCVTLTDDVPDLGAVNLRDAITSARPYEQRR